MLNAVKMYNILMQKVINFDIGKLTGKRAFRNRSERTGAARSEHDSGQPGPFLDKKGQRAYNDILVKQSDINTVI